MNSRFSIVTTSIVITYYYQNKFIDFIPKSYCSGNNSLLDAVGNTPLIYLKTLSEATGCTIYGKAEYMNPTGSVKDRYVHYYI